MGSGRREDLPKMTAPVTRQITLARRPVGVPVPEDFALKEAPRPVPGPGEILVRMRVCSCDPAIRGFLDD
ncbi:MAG: hypothetical protein ACK4Z7_13020, partial [Novosphingobium sp.]